LIARARPRGVAPRSRRNSSRLSSRHSLDARFFGSARLFFSLLLTFSRSLVPSRRQKGEFDFWEWFNNAACRDSGVIGAGYEDALKNGQFKGKKKK
jgi:hypothetical protein